MADVNGVNLESTNQEVFVLELSRKELLEEVGQHSPTNKGEVINVHSEVDKLKKMRVNVADFPEYLKKKLPLKLNLRITYSSYLISVLNQISTSKTSD